MRSGFDDRMLSAVEASRISTGVGMMADTSATLFDSVNPFLNGTSLMVMAHLSGPSVLVQ